MTTTSSYHISEHLLSQLSGILDKIEPLTTASWGSKEYENAINALYMFSHRDQETLGDYLSNGATGTYRILITAADGTVKVDTSKGDADTHINLKEDDDPINENHNSRVAIMRALNNESGFAREKKVSNTNVGTRKEEYYVAKRFGASPEEAIGVIRISTK